MFDRFMKFWSFFYLLTYRRHYYHQNSLITHIYRLLCCSVVIDLSTLSITLLVMYINGNIFNRKAYNYNLDHSKIWRKYEPKQKIWPREVTELWKCYYDSLQEFDSEIHAVTKFSKFQFLTLLGKLIYTHFVCSDLLELKWMFLLIYYLLTLYYVLDTLWCKHIRTEIIFIANFLDHFKT